MRVRVLFLDHNTPCRMPVLLEDKVNLFPLPISPCFCRRIAAAAHHGFLKRHRWLKRVFFDNLQRIEKMHMAMKKVFEVSFSGDDLIEPQVANLAVEAIAQALDRAKDLGLNVIGEPTVRLEGEYLDFDDFCKRYSLIKNPYDSSAAIAGCTFGWSDHEWRFVQNAATENLWTIVESEGLWWITPGLHYVNRLGYLLTQEKRNRDEPSYLYE